MKDDFNRDFIFSVAQDKTRDALAPRGDLGGPRARARAAGALLHGGPARGPHGSVHPPPYVRHKRSGRNIRRTMESVLPTITVSSIVEEPFAGEPFPGHDQINHASPTYRLSSVKLERTGASRLRT